MKLKLKVIYNAVSTLQKIAHSEINSKAAFKIGCLLTDLMKYFDNIEKERTKLINELGTKNKDGSMQIDAASDNYHKFIERFNACLEVEIDFNLEFSIDLEDLKEVKITPLQAQTINVFIKK